MNEFDIIQIYSGIIHGRVLNGELYAQRLQKLRQPGFNPRVRHIGSSDSSLKWRSTPAIIVRK